MDSDLEHNPAQIPFLLQSIKEGYDGAICQLRYQTEHQTELDYWFDGSQGVFQGNVILGPEQKFLHNCPGFTAYRADILEKILPRFKKYLQLYKKEYGVEPTWGEDMTLLFLAMRGGYNINILTVPSTGASPGRTIDKVLNQIWRNTAHLMLYQKIKKGQIEL